jgi:hypothetical protein
MCSSSKTMMRLSERLADQRQRDADVRVVDRPAAAVAGVASWTPGAQGPRHGRH